MKNEYRPVAIKAHYVYVRIEWSERCRYWRGLVVTELCKPTVEETLVHLNAYGGTGPEPL